MPPEGSFLRWFLTNRSIHVYITLSTLFSLALFTTFTNFRQTSPFAHMLPPTSDIFSHPIAFVSTYTEVFKLHTAHKSEETAERRKKKVDDAMKRKQYRKAHGMDSAQGGGVGGWFASLGEEPEKEEMANTTTDSSPTTADAAADAAREYADFEGRKRPVKKWLGIW
ncbi:MAG: hypothetical protein M1837_006912 [Sclerophora amabilis]|nr:MAG: hypothetical protein M1837_006912 [Sclerophora amabilis]